MASSALLAIIEVPHEKRVRCSADGCGHSVYKKVHLVRVDGHTQVYGSDCFAKLFGESVLGRSEPKYGGTNGRLLTPEEIAMLAMNTEHLVEEFEREHQEEIMRLEALRIAKTERHSCLQRIQATQTPLFAHPPTTTMQSSEAEAIARKRLAERFPGVNIDLAGFKGLLAMEISKIIRENAG